LEPAVHLRHITVSVASLPALAGALAGCGGSNAKPNAAQSSQPSQHAAAGGHALTISGFKFTPGSLTVTRGASLTVTNRDGTAHTATADDGRSFDTGNITPGATATVTLEARDVQVPLHDPPGHARDARGPLT
jgi:plastocyanin